MFLNSIVFASLFAALAVQSVFAQSVSDLNVPRRFCEAVGRTQNTVLPPTLPGSLPASLPAQQNPTQQQNQQNQSQANSPNIVFVMSDVVLRSNPACGRNYRLASRSEGIAEQVCPIEDHAHAEEVCRHFTYPVLPARGDAASAEPVQILAFGRLPTPLELATQMNPCGVHVQRPAIPFTMIPGPTGRETYYYSNDLYNASNVARNGASGRLSEQDLALTSFWSTSIELPGVQQTRSVNRVFETVGRDGQVVRTSRWVNETVTVPQDPTHAYIFSGSDGSISISSRNTRFSSAGVRCMVPVVLSDSQTSNLRTGSRR